MILIIGYGNPLRGDDAIGQHLAQTMRELLPPGSAEIHSVHQLTPEMAHLISKAQLVFFIDAHVGAIPGQIVHESVAADASLNSFTHFVTPALLLQAARSLYDKAPKGILISVVGAHFDYSSELSPQLQQKLPAIAEQVREIIESRIEQQLHQEANHA